MCVCACKQQTAGNGPVFRTCVLRVSCVLYHEVEEAEEEEESEESQLGGPLFTGKRQVGKRVSIVLCSSLFSPVSKQPKSNLKNKSQEDN